MHLVLNSDHHTPHYPPHSTLNHTLTVYAASQRSPCCACVVLLLRPSKIRYSYYLHSVTSFCREAAYECSRNSDCSHATDCTHIITRIQDTAFTFIHVWLCARRIFSYMSTSVTKIRRIYTYTQQHIPILQYRIVCVCLSSDIYIPIYIYKKDNGTLSKTLFTSLTKCHVTSTFVTMSVK